MLNAHYHFMAARKRYIVVLMSVAALPFAIDWIVHVPPKKRKLKLINRGIKIGVASFISLVASCYITKKGLARRIDNK